MTTPTPGTSTAVLADHRAHLTHELEHWGHLLPSQGPMTTFVHHNTLHGLQHKPFEHAVAEAEQLIGGRAYEPVDLGRARYRAGRIADADLDAVFAIRPELDPAEVLGTVGGRTISDGEIRKLHLLYGATAVPPAVLRHAMTSGEAGRRIAADVSVAARARLLSRSQQELAASLERIGAGWTLVDWLGALLDLDAPAAVLGDAEAHLAADATSTGAPVGRLLRVLGIPANRQEGYLAAVDAHCDSLPDTGRGQEHTRRLWLEAETRVVQGLARRHFGTRGTLDGLEAHCAHDLEGYAVAALWHSCLAAFALTDPYGPTDPVTLIGRDPDGVGERAAESLADIERWGGPAVPLPRGLGAAVRVAAGEALDRLRDRVAGDPGAADEPALREAACAAWFVMADADAGGLSRQGADALYDLARQADGATSSALQSLAGEVRANDPRQRLAAHLETVARAQLDRVGRDRTHADLVHALIGEDIVERVNRYLIRRCAAFLDLGQAAWRMPDRTLGFYEAWRRAAPHDHALDLDGLRGWREEAAALPEHPEEAVIALLMRLGVGEEHWGSYVGRVLTGLPGWAGMMNWRGTNPQFPRQQAQPTSLVQYLAVRLFVEVQLVTNVTRRTWNLEPADLVADLRTRPHEVWLRAEAAAGALPSFLARSVHELPVGGEIDASWILLADKAWAFHEQLDGARPRFRAHDHAWRLFRLAQLQGWSAADVRVLPATVRDRLLAVLDSFPESAHRPVWLAAFERHYREEILGALAANRGRGRWRDRPDRPKAQVVFCIDEREESMDRAFDELDPSYETFGAGGFFGVAMDYRGLDDHTVTPLCPANVTPANRVQEVPRPEAVPVAERRSALRAWEEVFHNTYWETKRNAVSAFFLTQLTGLIQAVPLAGRVVAPWRWTELAETARRRLVPRPPTLLTLDQDDLGRGFETVQQVDRVEAQLRNIGMTHHFARLVVFCGHGSVSVNNPHESAHDCGACGGKHGGPNGRAFAGLANRPVVRALLRERGIDIPDDTHFVGAIHNTASDQMVFFDTPDIPASHAAEWEALRADLEEARANSARERCRRFGSAPKDPTPAVGLRHVERRSRDLSQVRPEWGHCTNAFAIVGRRCLTQGAFFDRRGFVISYDPTQDPTGAIVERILLAMGPVGAGINLEYYFSSVDNRVYGCDTKVPHNVSGLLGVMEGAASDLRTGLPRQMIEIHEPMRLLLIVEATLDVLGDIYTRQPAIAELLDNEWVQLVAMDPQAGTFTRFVAGKGFVPWDERVLDLPVVGTSHEYYRGKEGFLPPVLIGTTGSRNATVTRS
ncbi:MAG: DUF2309 family protein [Chloroflexi bacterium]|nr:DUF2309 family protein [Chloroflexota bacterium]